MVLRLITALGLAQADKIVDGALAYAREHDLAPLAVCVLDAGGHTIVSKREDGAGILRLDIAAAKAWGALGMGLPSRVVAERLSASPAFLGAINHVSQGRLVPGLAGLLIAGEDGGVIGAVGISGDIGERDEEAALTGLAAAGLSAAQ